MVYPIVKLTILPIYRLWTRKIEGAENIPKNKTFIIAANHSSYFDVFLIPSILLPKLNKRMHALVNSYYWNGFITRFFLNLWQCIPVYVGKEPNAKEKNKLALEKVKVLGLDLIDVLGMDNSYRRRDIVEWLVD